MKYFSLKQGQGLKTLATHSLYPNSPFTCTHQYLITCKKAQNLELFVNAPETKHLAQFCSDWLRFCLFHVSQDFNSCNRMLFA